MSRYLPIFLFCIFAMFFARNIYGQEKTTNLLVRSVSLLFDDHLNAFSDTLGLTHYYRQKDGTLDSFSTNTYPPSAATTTYIGMIRANPYMISPSALNGSFTGWTYKYSSTVYNNSSSNILLRDTLLYDRFNNDSQITSSQYVNGSWQYTSRKKYYYSHANRLSSHTIETFKNGAWQINSQGLTIHYDLNGRLIGADYYITPLSGSGQQIFKAEFITYDSLGNISSIFHKDANGKLVDSYSVIKIYKIDTTIGNYPYNGAFLIGNILFSSVVKRTYSVLGLTLDRLTYTYNSDSLLKQVKDTCVSSKIKYNAVKIDYSYYADKSLHAIIRSEPKSNIWSIYGADSFVNIYNSDGSLASQESYSYNYGAAYMQPTRQEFYYSEFSTGIEENKINFSKNAKVYPNPSHGCFQITIPENLNGAAEIVICDLQGRTIYRSSILETCTDRVFEVKMNSVVKGMYIYHILLPKGVQEGKIVLE